MPKVSVVIPTYNRANLVGKTIESVMTQTFQDFEIVVVDDGSIDNTSEVISAYPVKYYKQVNQGPGAARNKGIEHSSGEYIAFLDSDDVYFKNTLEKSLNVLENNLEVGLSYGQAYVSDEKGNVIDIEPALKNSCIRKGWEELRNYLLTGYHVTMSTVVIRRLCLEQTGGFKADFRSGSEDLDLWIRLAKKFSVAYIAEPLAKWGPLTRGFSADRHLKDWEKANSAIIDSICDDPELSPYLHSIKPNAYFVLYSNLAKRASRRRDMKTARVYLSRALRVHPISMFKKSGLRWIITYFRTLTPNFVTTLASKIVHGYVKNMTAKTNRI